jgi:hypothetical protein
MRVVVLDTLDCLFSRPGLAHAVARGGMTLGNPRQRRGGDAGYMPIRDRLCYSGVCLWSSWRDTEIKGQQNQQGL